MKYTIETLSGNWFDGIMAEVEPVGEPDKNGVYHSVFVHRTFWESSGKPAPSTNDNGVWTTENHTDYPGYCAGKIVHSYTGWRFKEERNGTSR